jgi:serine/threonine-protein kinase
VPPPAAQPPQGSPRSSLWRAGTLIGGRYRLQVPIGAGAMGEVWRAEHATLGTAVAVKLVDTAHREDAEETLARFEIEARAAAQLKSPHVVHILDHGADGRVAFIAMELLEGESLEQRLARRGRLLPSEAAHVLREMARGMDRAHAAGIVHRDLKPPNVFLARVDGIEIVKVLDFGIAKFLGVPRAKQLETQAGFVVGTPAYMSPEQVLGKTLDPRSDLWQMAVVAFECVTGKRPFDGQTLGQLFMAICTQPLPVPSAVAGPFAGATAETLAAFDAWFARGANRDPALRFAGAGEMAEALGAIFAPGGVGESAIPTMAAAHRREGAAPLASGRHDGWSTGRVDPPKPRASSAALLLTLAAAPVLALATGGLWWAVARRHAAIDAAAVSASASSAPTPPPAATSTASAATPIEPAPAPASAAPAPPASSAAAKKPPPGRPGGQRRKGPDADRIGL